MSALLTEVDALRQQLAEKEAMIEQQKREDERIMREAREKEDTSWEHNIALLKSIFEPHQIRGEKEIAEFKKNHNRQLEQLNNAKNNVPGWGNICELAWKKKVSNCQQIYDREISRSRKSYEKDVALYHLFKRLDERLSHIERFLIDDIKKEEFLENKKSPVQWEKAAEKSADALIAKMSTC